MSKAEWLSRMSRLKKGRGNAPHKPLLLLVFLDMIENGEYETGQLFLTPEMGYRFDTYFEVAKHRRTARPDIRLPFHHLGYCQNQTQAYSPRLDNQHHLWGFLLA